MSEPIRDKAELQKFYDDPEVVATYLQRKALPLGAVLHARQVAFLNQAIARLRPARLLEVAPGPARLSAELRPVPLAVGLEFSPRMLAEARRRTRAQGVPQWRFVRGDGFALPFRAATFDFAFSVRFVRRFEPAPRQRLYAELRRVLKPGAHLVLDAQNRLVAGPHRAGHPHDYPVYDELWRRGAGGRARGRGLRGPTPGRHHAPVRLAAAPPTPAPLPSGRPGAAPDPRPRVDPRREPVDVDGARAGKAGLSQSS